MGLVTDWERIEMGQKITGWKNTVQKNIDRVDLVFAELVQAKSDYPSDTTEIDGYIAQLKTVLQNVINKY